MVARLSFTISERASLPACLLCLCLLHLSLSLSSSLWLRPSVSPCSPPPSPCARVRSPRARVHLLPCVSTGMSHRARTHVSLSLSPSLSPSLVQPRHARRSPLRARECRAGKELAESSHASAGDPPAPPPPPSRTASLDRRVGGRGGERGDKATRWSPGEISAIGPSNNRDVPSRASRARDTTLPAITRRDTPRG